jgi:uncharacterized membrane protein
MANRNSRKQDAEQRPPQVSAVAAVQHFEATTYSGPLPQAEQLQKYEEVLPGAADRIIRMAEEQSAHRQEIERQIVASASRDSIAGVMSDSFLTSYSFFSAIRPGRSLFLYRGWASTYRAWRCMSSRPSSLLPLAQFIWKR